MKTELLFGFHSVGEALNANRRRFEEIIFDVRRTGPRFDKLRAEAEKRHIRVTDTSHQRLGKLAGSDHHQGIAARVSPFAYSSIEEILATAAGQARSAFLLVLDGLVDSHNLGAVIRTALCAGVDGVIIPRDRSAAASAAVSRISAGALEHVRLARVTNLVRTVQLLKTEGVWIIGLAGRTPADIYDLDLGPSLALVLGGEEKGLRPLLKRQCDFLAAVPMDGPLDSLNASVAAAVALYEVRRQRSMAI